jgi:mannose-6-phosphate isomerase-like protein (cupin superfamily)
MIRKVHILAITALLPSLVTADNHSGSQLPDPLAAGWNGTKVCEQLYQDNDQRALRCAFPPGVGHERHYHDKNFGYVLAGGRMRITDASGTREVALVAGNSYASDGLEWHEVLNVGDTTVVFLMVEPLRTPKSRSPLCY